MNFNFVYNWNLLFLWQDKDTKERFKQDGKSGIDSRFLRFYSEASEFEYNLPLRWFATAACYSQWANFNKREQKLIKNYISILLLLLG